MTTSITVGPPKFFYGWVIVALGFLLQGLATGVTQYLIGIFAVPFGEDFDASRGAVLFATSSMMAAAGGVFSPVIGLVMQRVSTRLLLTLSAAWMGLGFLALANATSLWQIGFVFAGFLAAGVSTISIGTYALAAQWFVRRRGRAIGIIAAGTSTFGFIMPPVVALSIGAVGWRQSCVLLGILLLAIAPFIAWLAANKPELKGLRPDGDANENSAGIVSENAPAPQDLATWTTATVLLSGRFWVVSLCIALCISIAVAKMTSIVPAAIDSGVSSQKAAFLVSLVAACAVLGKIVFGIVADGISQRLMIWVPAILLIITALLLFSASSYGVYLVASVILGFALGAITPAWGTLVALNFGRSAFSLAQGLTTFVVSAAMFIAVPAAGWVRDSTDGYDLAWLALGAVVLVPAGLAFLLPTRRTP